MSSHPSEPNTLRVTPSARKANARQQLARLSVSWSDGTDYGLQAALLPDVTLAEAREALQALPHSLAEAVLEARQTSS